MELGAAGLHEQPFRTHGRPLVFVGYAGQDAAFKFLKNSYRHNLGLGIFQGPPLSGKTTLLRQFAERNSLDADIAVIDGANSNPTALLQDAISQFGYQLESASVNELMNMIKVFMQQQTASGNPPMLIVENTHEMGPDSLAVLCDLAKVRVGATFALRLILSSDNSISAIVDAPAMDAIARRLTQPFALRPLLKHETRDYLYAKLRAGGCRDPKDVLPEEVCVELHDASGGWPGIVDRLAILALAKADGCPIRPEQIDRPELPNFEDYSDLEDTDSFPQVDTNDEDYAPPKLILTVDGKTVCEMEMTRPRLLVGRSQHNDIIIDSAYISRHHALFVKFGPATLLMDLNSKNGVFVNSRRVSNQIMVHNDIVSLGHHRIKFIDPTATERASLDDESFTDTAIMKDLSDLRRQMARDTTISLPQADNTGGDNKS